MNDLDVIPCCAADIRALMAFRKGEGEAQSGEDDEYGRWLYERAVTSASLFRCEDEGRINAHVCGHRATLRVLGDELSALWLVGLFVARAGRRRGLGTRLVKKVAEQAPLSMAVDVSVAARGAFVEAGWQLLGNLPVYVRAIEPAALLREKRRPKLAAALGAPLRVGMAGLCAAEAGIARLQSVRLEEVDRFDERCDEVWRKVSVEHPIAVRRDAAYAARRFEAVHWHSYRRFLLTRDGALEGFAVVRTEQRGGLRVAEIVDYLCPSRSLRALFAACARKFGGEGCEAIYCVSQDARADGPFKRAGFVRRDSGWPFFVYANGLDAATTAAVLEPGNWFVTRADSNLDRPRLSPGEDGFEAARPTPESVAQTARAGAPPAALKSASADVAGVRAPAAAFLAR
jgi:GNAT superfamily N-acetyltransferase